MRRQVLRIWLFGVVRVQADGGSEWVLPEERAQRLLAWLALTPGARHSRQQAAAVLWPGRGDDSLRQALRELRTALGREACTRHLIDERGLVGLRGEIWTDVEEFERRRASDPEGALELANGRLLDSVQRSAGAWDEARRRESTDRVAETLGQAAERRMRRGQPGGAVRLARRRHELRPDSEPAIRDLMRYLASAGEREEALGVYRSWARRRPPSEATTKLKQAIATGTLDGSSPDGAPHEQRRPTQGRRWVRRAFVPAIAGLVLAGAVLALAAPDDGPETGTAAACPASLTEPSEADRRVSREAPPKNRPRPRALPPVSVGTRPASVAIASDGVWVAERQGVALIDPQLGRQIGGAIAVGGGTPNDAAYAIAVAEDRLWVTRRDGYLESIDRATREVVGAPIRYGGSAAEVTVGAGAVWVNNFDDDFEGMLTRIDPCSGELSRIKVGREADSVRFGHGSLWVTDAADGLVARIDPDDGSREATISGLDDPQDLLITPDAVWVTQYGPQQVRRIDPDRNELVGPNIPVGPDPAGVTIGAGSLWVPLYGNGTLTEVDLASGESREGVVSVGRSPTDAAYGFGRVWVPDNNGDSVTPVAP